jgi:hypothetical protein
MRHLQSNGFQVEARNVSDERLVEVAEQAGVPADLGACHTAQVGGYVVEGHVPAADVQRLLRERPRITGIAVAGMPVGSPGMESGNRRQPFEVIAFTRGSNSRTVFARH